MAEDVLSGVGDFGGGTTGRAKSGGKEMTWDQLVKKLGVDKARETAPSLDPAYQQLVASEGQAKGSADYSHKYIDPQTVTAQGWAGLGSKSQIEQGIAEELGSKSKPVQYLGALGEDIMNPVAGGKNPISDVMGNKPVETKEQAAASAAAAKAAAAKKNQPTVPAAGTGTAAEQLMNSLVSQYTTEMANLQPYISGQQGRADSTSAQQAGAAIAGGGVQAPGPNTTMNADFAAEAAANKAGGQGVATALTNQGVANQIGLNISPYAGTIAALMAGAQYNVERGTSPEAKNSPAFLTDIYNQIGAGVSSATAGATPVTAPAPPVVPAGSPAAGGNTQ